MVVYSRLCDTSERAYQSYLFALLVTGGYDGTAAEYFKPVDRATGLIECDSSYSGSGGVVSVVDAGRDGSSDGDAMVGMDGGCVEGGVTRVGDSGLVDGGQCVDQLEGVSGDCFDNNCSSSAGVGRDGVFLGSSGASTEYRVPVVSVPVRGKNWASNRKKRLSAKSRAVKSEGVSPVEVGFSHKRVTTQEEQDTLARQWFERKKVENALAIQKGEYQLKRNEWLSKSRVSEKKWEEERLRCEEKLDALSKARLGHGPAGFAETVYSDGSVTPPSLSRGDSTPATLSDGTLSPDSSISVAELRRMEKKFSTQEEKIAELEMCLSSLKAITFSKLSSSSDVDQFDAALDGEVKEKVTYGVPNVSIMGSVVDGFSVDTDCF